MQRTTDSRQRMPLSFMIWSPPPLSNFSQTKKNSLVRTRTSITAPEFAKRPLFSNVATLKAAVNGPISNDGSVGGKGPLGPFFSSDRSGELRWKDKVALFAQISPEETLECLLDALRANNAQAGPIKDDGIDALYSFANFDVFSVSHIFFGKTMDLGQFERFRRVIIIRPYSALLSYTERSVLSALRFSPDKYVSRVLFKSYGDQDYVFKFSLSKVKLGNHESWMVDSLIPESTTDE